MGMRMALTAVRVHNMDFIARAVMKVGLFNSAVKSEIDNWQDPLTNLQV
jgi:hypothetical protein